MLWVKVHRWLAIVLVAFLVVWSVTALLFLWAVMVPGIWLFVRGFRRVQ